LKLDSRWHVTTIIRFDTAQCEFQDHASNFAENRFQATLEPIGRLRRRISARKKIVPPRPIAKRVASGDSSIPRGKRRRGISVIASQMYVVSWRPFQMGCLAANLKPPIGTRTPIFSNPNFGASGTATLLPR
jgi:hypothetical protein